MKLFWLILLLLVVGASGSAQEAAVKQITAKLTEIERQLVAPSVSPDLKTRCTKDIADARATLKLQRPLASLYTIRPCQIELAKQIAKLDNTAFLTEKLKVASARTNAKKLSSLAVALADISLVEADHYYQSSIALSAKDPAEATVNLAKATATVDFANFVLGLHLPERKLAYGLKSLEPELTKLGTSAMRTYKAAGANAPQGQFNRLKSTVESAVELNRASKFEAALVRYLESELYFGLIVTAAENEDSQHLRERSGELGKLLISGKIDNSIGLFFWEIADTNLNPVSGEPTAVQLKTAVVILNRVLPGYFDYQKRLGPPPKP